MESTQLPQLVSVADLTTAEAKKEMVAPDGVVAFACANLRQHYFVPTQDCTFGGINIPYVMFDTGCNTHLLPLRKEQVKELIQRYPPWVDGMVWSVHEGIHPSLHLTSWGKSIPVVFGFGCKPVSFTTAENEPFLRFSLDEECVAEILKCDKEHAMLIDGYRTRLQEYLQANRGRIPSRRHAIVGQSLFRNLGYMLVQTGGIAFVVDSINSMNWDKLGEIRSKLVRLGHEAVDKWGEEFQDLEDEDHDGDSVAGCASKDF